ncbi:HEAT repeat domain-containing protein [Candidatus Electrothrix sp.]|uniref:HEAT repeat domain-containing protein n=2 Tax=Candidatus Electrothrix sp. TaxID=2170559 RepID=UPI004057143E
MKNNTKKIAIDATLCLAGAGICYCVAEKAMAVILLDVFTQSVTGNSFTDLARRVLSKLGVKKDKKNFLFTENFILVLGEALEKTIPIKKIKEYKLDSVDNVCKENVKSLRNDLKKFIKYQQGDFEVFLQQVKAYEIISVETTSVESRLQEYLEKKLIGCDRKLATDIIKLININELIVNFNNSVEEIPGDTREMLMLISKNHKILESIDERTAQIPNIAAKTDDIQDEVGNIKKIVSRWEEGKKFYLAAEYGESKRISEIYSVALSRKYGSMKVDFLEDGLQGDRSFNIKALYWPLKLKKFKDRYQEEDRPSRAGNSAPPERENKEQLQVSTEKFSIGAELQRNPRLVVLGEAGAGKSTLTAWLVIAELLRRSDDPSCKDFPDIEELGSVKNRLPVIIQCNAIKSYLAEDRGADFNDILDRYVKDLFRTQAIDKSVKDLVRSFLTENFNQGQVILIFDGLDEVQSEQKSENLVDLITQLAQKYTSVPIILTSRIEDYSQRTQGRLTTSGFQHVEISSLSISERDRFIDHWCRIKGTAQDELEEIVPQIKHSIRTLAYLKERTKNIFMLTIVTHLYLNGRSENLRNDGLLLHEVVKCFIHRKNRGELKNITLFLGYIAYEMRKEKTVSIDIQDVIYLFEEENRFFSKDTKEWLLKSRKTGLLIESDGTYKFSHDFFCDYFAGSAIKERRFPGYDRHTGGEVSRFIRILSGKVQEKYISGDKYEYIVAREWQAPIRYCLNICDDGDKEQCLLRMINTDDDENPQETVRARSVMAAFCLKEVRKDENVEEEVGKEIIENLVKNIRKYDELFDTELKKVSIELWKTEWKGILENMLLENFITSNGADRVEIGAFYSEFTFCDFSEESENKEGIVGLSEENLVEDLINELNSNDYKKTIRASLILLERFYRKKIRYDLRLNNALFNLIQKGITCSTAEKSAITYVAVWTLYWLHYNYTEDSIYQKPSEEQIEYLYTLLEYPESDKYAVAKCIDILKIFKSPGREKYRFTSEDRIYNWIELAETGKRKNFSANFTQSIDERLVENLIKKLDDEEKIVRENSALLLGRFNIWKEKSVQPLLDVLHDETKSDDSKLEAVEYLGCIRCNDSIVGLIEELESDDSERRFYAMLALVGLSNTRAIEPLLAKLNHSQAETRQYIATILGTLEDLRVPDVLTKLVEEDNNEYVKKECRKILKRIYQDL